MRGPIHLVAALAFALAAPTGAHDFWVQPAAFSTLPGAIVPITLQVGHGSDRARSAIPLRRIARFAAVAPDGSTVDLRGRLRPGAPDADGDLCFEAPGVYVLVLETDDRAHSHLPAARFNAHLETEGLTPAIERRRRMGWTSAPGTEVYGRRAKTIVQVGPRHANAGTQVTRPLGLTLEIVPEVDPNAEPRPAKLPVQVFYEGRPLAGALVRIADLEDDAKPLEARRTDRSGRATFALPARGTRLLTAVWTKPLPKSSGVDFETLFSSLSFAVGNDAP